MELLFELLEGELQRAKADRLDVAHVNLILAAQFVHAKRAAQRDVQAVVGTELQQPRLVAETDAANLRARIFQGEIKMAGLRRTEIGDFAFDPDILKSAFEQIADLLRDLTDLPHAPLRHQIEK